MTNFASVAQVAAYLLMVAALGIRLPAASRPDSGVGRFPCQSPSTISRL